ncbi:MAG: hypothetical protein RL077_5392, partial [Verrucomicrobiota bacterium]
HSRTNDDLVVPRARDSASNRSNNLSGNLSEIVFMPEK